MLKAGLPAGADERQALSLGIVKFGVDAGIIIMRLRRDCHLAQTSSKRPPATTSKLAALRAAADKQARKKNGVEVVPEFRQVVTLTLEDADEIRWAVDQKGSLQHPQNSKVVDSA